MRPSSVPSSSRVGYFLNRPPLPHCPKRRDRRHRPPPRVSLGVGIAAPIEYGLAAGIWTRDLKTAHTVAAKLEAGIVSINEFPLTFPQTPFVGWKNSGLGHEQGLDAIRFYTRLKNVNVNLE